jgi:hypothetical protein
MGQNVINDYATAIQWQLNDIITPVPVYSNFNRNWATQEKFVTWHLTNVHQPVYTGIPQNNKGIDTPTFDISIYTKEMPDCYDIADSIIQALHGYQGMFGNPSTSGFPISKADVVMRYQSYDDEIRLYNILMDCTLYIPT